MLTEFADCHAFRISVRVFVCVCATFCISTLACVYAYVYVSTCVYSYARMIGGVIVAHFLTLTNLHKRLSFRVERIIVKCTYSFRVPSCVFVSLCRQSRQSRRR